MFSYEQGQVTKVIEKNDYVTEIIVLVSGKEEKAINYNLLTGPVGLGDRVILNTTAVRLNLGTGGYHFVINNLKQIEQPIKGSGHIMKMRYTPFQIKVLSVEEATSPFHNVMSTANNLNNTPVIIGTLHSMLTPITWGIKTRSSRDLKVICVMTDGAALPLAFSKTIPQLRKKKLIHGTITIGNAFGGDIEAVNIYSGLLAAKHVLKADIIVVTMGPGIVGTGTKWGFSGIEQGQIINAVESLGGIPIAVPRISFVDQRQRHYGLSHHTITVLEKIALAPAIVPLAKLYFPKLKYVLKQWKEANLGKKHFLKIIDVHKSLNELIQTDLKVSTMGRKIHEDQEFFATAVASGAMAVKYLIK
ncbi:DUF3866 family protein [Bacillota bacterium LX-D]|nr:DUF3866 family protein [Bacillota bacterium LX-D]